MRIFGQGGMDICRQTSYIDGHMYLGYFAGPRAGGE